MGHGVWETVKKQAIWAAGGGLAGAIIGGIAGYQFDDFLVNNYKDWQGYKMAAGEQAKTSGQLDRVSSPKTIPAVTGVTLGMMKGAEIGEAVGFETAVLGYNKKIVAKEKLPPVKFYDWVVSNAGLQTLKYLVGGRNLGRVGTWGMLIANEVFNPISVAGMRAVGTGLWEMRKGK